MYLLADDRLVLIDTGLPGNAATILKFIRTIGRDPAELAAVILTHGHMDHAGSLAALMSRTGAKGLAHSGEVVTSSSGGYTLLLNSPVVRLISKVLSYLKIIKPGHIDYLLKDEEVLPYSGGLRIIHTPGHTPGSISLLLEKQRILFVGDMIINNRDHLSRPLPFKTDKVQAESSLAKLASLQFDTCCFGHGPPLISRAQEKVLRLAVNRPNTPLYRRLLRNRRRIMRFFVGLGRKS